MARRTIKTDDLAKDLRLIRIGPDEYAVVMQAGLNGQLTIGRIARIRWQRSSSKASWFWTITGPAERAGFELLSEATDLEVAKSEFSKTFSALIDWCDANRDGNILWTIR